VVVVEVDADAVAFGGEAEEVFADGAVAFGVEEVFGEEDGVAGIIPTIDLAQVLSRICEL